MRDRFFDFYVNDPMVKIFFDGFRPEGQKDPYGVQQAKDRLDIAFAMLDHELADKTWAMGDLFSMADCAAAPALGYCRMVYPFTKHKNVVAYMNRLAERPSFQRVLNEAAPYLAAFKK
jgi:glutathione S-transferase